MPGLRGSLLDRHGNALAASEDAATIYATPYQVKNPPQAAEKLAPILDQEQGRGAESLTEESRLLLRRPQGRPADRGADRTARAGRDRPAARQPPHLPAGRDGGAGDRRRRLRKPGADRARGGRGIGARAAATANGAIVNDALGEPIRLETVERSRGRRRHPADARPGDPGEDRSRCSPESAKRTRRRGRRRSSIDPRSSQVLAMANWPPVDPADLSEAEPRRPAEPGDRVHLRAGLDLQGVHRRRRAGRKTGDAGDRHSPCRRRSRSPTGRSKTPRNAAPKR